MGQLHSILLSTDFRQSSQLAAEATVQLAQKFQCQVYVLHMREEYLTWPVTPFEYQDQLTEYLQKAPVNLAEFMVHAGPVADTIVRKTDEMEADLLVIGLGEKQRDGYPALGPIAEAILEQATTPVLALNPHGPKLQFQTILCPVDHSSASRRGLEDAIHLARAYGSQLIVLSIVPEVTWLEAAIETGQLDGAKDEHVHKWIQEFDEFLKPISLEGVNWKREVRHGNPHEQILAVAKETQADLITMGATGRTGIIRVLLGSVTRRMLKQLPCSLLLVKDHVAFEEQYLVELETIERYLVEAHTDTQAGKFAEAAGKYRQVLNLDPYHRQALRGITQTYDQLGQPDAVQRYRKRLQRLEQTQAQ